jgi:DNA-binding NarL/FixJ family response regulator
MKSTSNILLVDDHQIVLDGIKSMLSEQDQFHIIAQALSAESAWEILEANELPIDMVVTDISMHGMSGIELCQKNKKHLSKYKSAHFDHASRCRIYQKSNQL